MSNAANDSLIDEAMDYINSGDLSSTPMEEMLEHDIESGDLTSLWGHILEVRNFLREDEAGDAY